MDSCIQALTSGSNKLLKHRSGTKSRASTGRANVQRLAKRYIRRRK